ncbi:MAG: hypothetical protein LLG16_01035 [Euryarchaeota archaeon]|nr:hypothetical protein [Euryarchaeota archaeon]
MKSIDLNGCRVTVLPVIKGLVSEEKKVQDAIDEVAPDAVGISISKEELEGLSHKEEYEFMEPSFLEHVYKLNLETFGDVKMPPPCYVRAMDLCTERGIRIVPLDMNEELFSETYCDKVGGFDLIRDSFFSSRAHKVKFDLSSPERFVLDYDRKANGGKGLRQLNREREAHMSTVLKQVAGKHRNILVVVELERAEGLFANVGNGIVVS